MPFTIVDQITESKGDLDVPLWSGLTDYHGQSATSGRLQHQHAFISKPERKHSPSKYCSLSISTVSIAVWIIFYCQSFTLDQFTLSIFFWVVLIIPTPSLAMSNHQSDKDMACTWGRESIVVLEPMCLR